MSSLTLHGVIERQFAVKYTSLNLLDASVHSQALQSRLGFISFATTGAVEMNSLQNRIQFTNSFLEKLLVEVVRIRNEGEKIRLLQLLCQSFGLEKKYTEALQITEVIPLPEVQKEIQDYILILKGKSDEVLIPSNSCEPWQLYSICEALIYAEDYQVLARVAKIISQRKELYRDFPLKKISDMLLYKGENNRAVAFADLIEDAEQRSDQLQFICDVLVSKGLGMIAKEIVLKIPIEERKRETRFMILLRNGEFDEAANFLDSLPESDEKNNLLDLFLLGTGNVSAFHERIKKIPNIELRDQAIEMICESYLRDGQSLSFIESLFRMHSQKTFIDVIIWAIQKGVDTIFINAIKMMDGRLRHRALQFVGDIAIRLGDFDKIPLIINAWDREEGIVNNFFQKLIEKGYFYLAYTIANMHQNLSSRVEAIKLLWTARALVGDFENKYNLSHLIAKL